MQAQSNPPDSPAAPRARILRLALPLVISFGLRSIYSLVDSAFAVQLKGLGDASVAAIGFTVPIEFLMTACWVGTSNGLTAQLSAAMGAGDSERIEALKRATTKIVLALIALFLSLACAVWWIAPKLGLEASVAGQLKVYATVLIAGQALTAFWAILPDSLVKAHHDMKSTMWAGLISGSTNVALNAVFVFVFGWGIFGIALSTVLSRLFSLGYARRRAATHERRRLSEPKPISDQVVYAPQFGSAVRQILFIAVPSALGFVLMAGESFAVNWIVKSTGDGGHVHASTISLAAWSLYDRGARFLTMPMIAVGVAMLPLVARLYGQRDFASIRNELKVAAKFGLAYVFLLVTPAMLFFGGSLADFFTETAAARDLAATGMWWLPLASLVAAPFFIVRSAFEGMGKPRPGMVVSAIRGFVLVVPLTYAGVSWAPQWGYSGLVGAFAGSTMGTGLASIWMAVWLFRVLKAPNHSHPE